MELVVRVANISNRLIIVRVLVECFRVCVDGLFELAGFVQIVAFL